VWSAISWKFLAYRAIASNWCRWLRPLQCSRARRQRLLVTLVVLPNRPALSRRSIFLLVSGLWLCWSDLLLQFCNLCEVYWGKIM
jgi:hypothetical protein